MRHFTILILFIIFNQGLTRAQNKLDSTTYLINRLIEKVNSLPRTNISGQGDFLFQSGYSINLDKGKLTLIDKRYEPNSDKELLDKHITEIDISCLHKNGIYVKSLHNDKNISLQFFTANNDKKIKSLIFNNGEYRFGMYHDRLTIGAWDSSEINNQLDAIKDLLVKIIQLNTDWDDKTTPDIKKIVMPETIKQPDSKYSTITYELNADSPLFLNSTIEEPALFLDAKSDNGNRIKINDYVLEQINKNGIKLNGNLSGTIIISKSGKIEDFKSFNINKPKTEQEIKEIILSMPEWKAGKHKGEYVRTSHTILIKK